MRAHSYAFSALAARCVGGVPSTRSPSPPHPRHRQRARRCMPIDALTIAQPSARPLLRPHPCIHHSTSTSTRVVTHSRAHSFLHVRACTASASHPCRDYWSGIARFPLSSPPLRFYSSSCHHITYLSLSLYHLKPHPPLVSWMWGYRDLICNTIHIHQ